MGPPTKIEVMSADEYLRWETDGTVRHEYVDGHAYAMTGGTERHSRIAGNIFFPLRAAARGSTCGVYVADMKVRVRALNVFYYPDVVLASDRREKWFAYRRLESLRYYLLVDPDKVAVQYFVRDDEGEWRTSTLDPGEVLTVDCGRYKAALSLEDIYEDTGLEIPA